MVTIPKINEIYNDILSDIQTELGISIPSWKKAFLRALAIVLAGNFYLLYLLLGKIQKNIFVDTADSELSGGTLERFGRIKLGRNPFPATQGKYEVELTGIAGGLVKGGTTFIADDSSHSPGKLFIIDQDYVMPASVGSVVLRALESGTGSRLSIGDTLSASSPIINVDGSALVIVETEIPNSAEPLELYREKVIERFRLSPQGSASADYRLWGKDAAGVKQIYPYAASGRLHEVDVYVEANVTDSTDGMGTPTTTTINDVVTCIEANPVSGRGRRPLAVFAVNVMPVTICRIRITISGFQGLTVPKQNIIFQGLSEAINKIRPFVAGADILSNQNDVLSETKIVYIIQDTLRGANFNGAEMEMSIGGALYVQVSFKQFGLGQIPFLEEVVYV